MSTQQRSSLGLELIELAHALESVRLVSDCDRARAFPAASDSRVVPQAVSATVSLVADRLRSLGHRLSDEAGEGARPPPAASAAGRRAPRAARRA